MPTHLFRLPILLVFGCFPLCRKLPPNPLDGLRLPGLGNAKPRQEENKCFSFYYSFAFCHENTELPVFSGWEFDSPIFFLSIGSLIHYPIIRTKNKPNILFHRGHSECSDQAGSIRFGAYKFIYI